MTDNRNNPSAPISVRVDLTSQDLRTGIIRLPLQLHDSFAPGELQAHTDEADETLELTFSPPRELGGLQAFLEKYELRTNDAVVLHVDGIEVRLEPFYRRPAAKSSEPAPATGQGLFGEMQMPSDHSDSEVVESDSGFPPIDPELQPGLFETPDSAQQPASGAGDMHESAADTLRAESPAGPDSNPAAPSLLIESAGTDSAVRPDHAHADPAATEDAVRARLPDAAPADPLADFATSWTDESTDDFEGGHADFAAFNQPDRNHDEVESPPADDFDVASESDDLPAMPAWQAPLGQPEAATQASAFSRPSAAGSHSAFHRVQRRPFTPRGHPQPGQSQLLASAGAAESLSGQQPEHRLEAGARHGTSTDPQTATVHRAVQPDTSAHQAGSKVSGQTLREQISSYLDSPNLPSILQAKQVAKELHLSEEEAADELASLSQLPDSRLSSVRPGFYLLKRESRA